MDAEFALSNFTALFTIQCTYVGNSSQSLSINLPLDRLQSNVCGNLSKTIRALGYNYFLYSTLILRPLAFERTRRMRHTICGQIKIRSASQNTCLIETYIQNF
jgi:hypothetical protein